MSSKIIRCTCAHEFQDGLYGVGNRMANELRNGQFSCTVCGSVVGSSQSVHQAPKAKEPEEDEPKKKPVGQKCPDGHKFGKDADEYEECRHCKIWEDCAGGI